MKTNLLWKSSKYLPTALLALVAALGGTGCKHQPAHASAGPAGTYRLIAVDGKGLPASVRHDQAQLVIQAGTISLAPGGTLTSYMEFTVPSGRSATNTVTGSYTCDGSAVHMKWDRAGRTEGTWRGKEFSMVNEGMVLNYRQ